MENDSCLDETKNAANDGEPWCGLLSRCCAARSHRPALSGSAISQSGRLSLCGCGDC